MLGRPETSEGGEVLPLKAGAENGGSSATESGERRAPGRSPMYGGGN